MRQSVAGSANPDPVTPPPSPDFIVVGAGSSGCAIVNRLSADPATRVLLIEAGESGETDPDVVTPGRWVSLIGSRYDWGYETEPEAGLDGRRIGVPRGRAFGGSSAINAMAHIRGHRASFDRWRALGNPGWGYDDLLPLFRRSEDNDAGVSPYRGVGGPLAVSHCDDPHEGHHAFLRAAGQQGFRADPRHDFNHPEPEGVAGFYQKNIRNGRRHSAAAAYLVPALARTNVQVLSSARAVRIVVEKGRAIAVEFLRDGRVQRVEAEREVVLAAGAVDSPRLLMASGIGPAAELAKQGIRVVADLPGVGRNLQDHLRVSVRWKGTGALPGSTVTAGLFVSSAPSTTPGLQFYVGRGLADPDEFVTITVSHVRPASRGHITLRSSEPAAPPSIQANYLQEPSDLDALVRGVALARDIGSSPAYDRLRGEPLASLETREELERFVRQQADTIFHMCGTCRMGPASDAGAVVDAALRVHGIAGLRVADASIMPEIVSAPTHAATVVIGEKCAGLLLAQ